MSFISTFIHKFSHSQGKTKQVALNRRLTVESLERRTMLSITPSPLGNLEQYRAMIGPPAAAIISPAFQAVETKLFASDGATGDGLGNSVSVSGNTLVVGSPFANYATGAAYVFTKSSSGLDSGSRTQRI